MRILILYNVARQIRKGTKSDLSCEVEIEIIAPMIRDVLREAGHVALLWEVTYELWERLKISRSSFDLVVNLAEAFGGTNSYEPLVPAMLEALQIPFTGASSHNMMLTLDKVLTKRVAQSINVNTPKFAVAYDEFPFTITNLRAPLIVKPAREEASIGITLDSVVADASAVQERVNRIKEVYRQPAVIEEFVDGREISIGLVGNGRRLRVLPALEFLFVEAKKPEEKIRSYEYKWGGKKETMVRADLDDNSLQVLRSYAVEMFNACECRDYARMDFRLSDKGVYLLEVNYNPGIGPNTHGLNNTLTMMASFEGRSFADLVLEIVEAAAIREALVSPPL